MRIMANTHWKIAFARSFSACFASNQTPPAIKKATTSEDTMLLGSFPECLEASRAMRDNPLTADGGRDIVCSRFWLVLQIV